MSSENLGGNQNPDTSVEFGWMGKAMGFCLENKLLVLLGVLFSVLWGLSVAPFDWQFAGLPRDPVPVDAIPDTGENQQIVFAEWSGRSPQDVEDQVTYPLTTALLGVPGVKSVRSSSMFGFASIYVIFNEDVEFYWSRSRLLEKLNSLPMETLPTGVQPVLGPDATALGQIFWYTLEGRDEEGQVTGGWDLHELRSTQDWQVRYALSSVEGVAEVASIGGYVQEYQIDVDPDAMRAHGVTLEDVFRAVSASNVDVGARTIEVNRVEYVVRGLGLIKSLADIEKTVVGVSKNVPIMIEQIANVALGPALRRGALDKAGAETVGGVVVARYGANPLEVIQAVKRKIAELSAGLPTKELEDGRLSRVTVVPFYDRSELIGETLGTLKSALTHELLVTLIVVLVMLGHLRSALLVAGLVPLAVLLCFVAMKYFGVDANVVALSGIAIAIGTMVDVGIVLTESVLVHVKAGGAGQSSRQRLRAIQRGASEVGGAVLTAVLTTVVSFLPVIVMRGAEGKLFRPLAYTKSFALLASILVALAVIPPLMHLLLGRSRRPSRPFGHHSARWVRWSLAIAAAVLLAKLWSPLGPTSGAANLLFTVGVLGVLLLAFQLLLHFYEPLLRWCLSHKLAFLSLPAALVAMGLLVWLGFPRLASPLLALTNTSSERAVEWPLWPRLSKLFPGLGREFMPALDEGSFLLMPVTMAHASIGESLELLQQQDKRISAIPEVAQTVGKIGRVESPLDPAPVSMVETVIHYKPEFRLSESGKVLRFAHDAESGFARDEQGLLIPDPDGEPFREWREQIQSPGDIWHEIELAARVPGMTTASMLQPIETRRIMLQTGMRAPMGIKVYGSNLELIEQVALDFEGLLKEVPSVRPETVLADRVVGKPYLEIDIDRAAIARHGLSMRAVQDVIEVAIGGRQLTTTIEGRERYPVRVRYQRELRGQIEDLRNILVSTMAGAHVPLGQLANVRYTRGPQSIKSEDTLLVAYVLFDKQLGEAEVDVVEAARAHLQAKLDSGEYVLPTGVSYRFAGNYENQQRAAAKLRLVLPVALLVIFVLLFLQFRSVITTGIVFSGVFVAWSGGFLLLWLYGQDWFLDSTLFGVDWRELFGVHPVNLSVAVWVGFLALFGIATDDGVLMATYLRQRLNAGDISDVDSLRQAVVEAGLRRIRPCLMTTATTALALLPVLTSTGRGADVMVPMAIPSVGGVAVALIAIFVVPTLTCWVEELKLRRAFNRSQPL